LVLTLLLYLLFLLYFAFVLYLLLLFDVVIASRGIQVLIFLGTGYRVLGTRLKTKN
jgi:hypothetical protein